MEFSAETMVIFLVGLIVIITLVTMLNKGIDSSEDETKGSQDLFNDCYDAEDKENCKLFDSKSLEKSFEGEKVWV